MEFRKTLLCEGRICFKNVIHALLIDSGDKKEEEREFASKTYSQTFSGINEPTLKVMCHGPDIDLEPFIVEDKECDINFDEEI